jgi:hypothetical protein
MRVKKVDIKIEGFLEGKRETSGHLSNLHYYPSHLLLDEVMIHGTLRSLEEIEHFIYFLETLKPCFNNGR